MSKKIVIILTLILLNGMQGAYSQEIEQSEAKPGEVLVQDLQQDYTKVPSQIPAEALSSESLNADNSPQSQTNTQLQSEITLCLPKDQVPITFEGSLKTALDNNYGIKIIESQREQNKWLFYNSLSEFLPDASFNYSQTRFGGQFLVGGVVPVSITATNINTGFAAQWDGFTGFRRYFETQATRSAYTASRKNVELTKDQVLLLTTRQYYTLLQDKLNIEILERALDQTQAQLTIAQQRLDAGVGTRFDVLRAETEVSAARQNLIAAVNRLRLSQAQLANTIGVNVFTPLIPADLDVEAKTLFKDCFDLAQVTEIALKNKPELDIAELNIAAIRARRNSAYSTYLPTVSVRSTVNWTGDELADLNQNQSVALLVSWIGGENLGLAGFTSIKVLNAQVQEAKLRLVDTTRNLEQSLINSYYDIITTRELIQAARSEVISAEESLRLAVIRFQEGVGIYTDVIDAQLTETQARIRYLNAIINYNISQAQLLFDMGVIAPSNLTIGYEAGNEKK